MPPRVVNWQRFCPKPVNDIIHQKDIAYPLSHQNRPFLLSIKTTSEASSSSAFGKQKSIRIWSLGFQRQKKNIAPVPDFSVSVAEACCFS